MRTIVRENLPWISMTARLVAFSLLSFSVLLLLSPSSVAAADTSTGSNTVTRRGDTLLLDGRPFRFGGANIYWLGLDENVPPGTIAYPTTFRIDDALRTVLGMANRVVRSHTLGISCGNPLSFEPELGVFNTTALHAADYAVHRAEQLGLKLIVPLTDNYHYYHGGKHCYTDWLGNPDENAFYTNETVVSAFEAYVRALLEHVNPFTQRPYWDTDAILAWETGNELLPTPGSNWTANLAAFIKTIDTQHLVLSGTYGVSLEELPEIVIDMHSDHFYPPDSTRAALDAALCASYGKVFVAGEIGWNYNGSQAPGALLQTLETTNATAGGLFWSLFSHLDTYGFVQHNDGFTIHYPGDFPFMHDTIALFAQYAAAMAHSGDPSMPASWVPPPVATGAQPTIDLLDKASNANALRLAWRGAALAATYHVYGCNSSSDNTTTCHDARLLATNITDNETPLDFAARTSQDRNIKMTSSMECFSVVPAAWGGDTGLQSVTDCYPRL